MTITLTHPFETNEKVLCFWYMNSTFHCAAIISRENASATFLTPCTFSCGAKIWVCTVRAQILPWAWFSQFFPNLFAIFWHECSTQEIWNISTKKPIYARLGYAPFNKRRFVSMLSAFSWQTDDHFWTSSHFISGFTCVVKYFKYKALHTT